MESTFGLEIYASNKLAYAGRARSLVVLRYEDADGNKVVAAVSNGFVEMINNRAKLFCLSVERPEEIDIRRAQEAKERAEEQLRQKQSIQEYHMNQLALARAMTRLRVTKNL